MADQTASFAIALEDETSGAADSAASSLESLKEQIAGDVGALREMQAAMRNLRAATNPNAEAIQNLNEQIVAQKASIGSAQAQYVELGGTFGDVGEAADEAGDGMADFGENMQRSLGRGASQSITRIKSLISALGAGGLYSVALVAVVAVVALGAAVAALVYEMAKLALTNSDAARTEMLMLEGLTGSSAAAAELSESISRVSANVAIGSDKVSGFAKDLTKAGLKGAEMESALEAASITAAVLGDEAASAFMKEAEAAAKAGKSVEELAAKAKAKLGPINDKLMLSLTVQTMKAKEGFAKIFSGVKLDGFLSGLSEVTKLLDSNSASGKALKQIVEVMFNGLFDTIGALGPFIKNFFRGMIVAALMATIAILKVRNAIMSAFGDDTKSSVDWLKVAFYVGVVAAAALVVGLFVLGAALVVIVALLGMVALFVLFLSLPFIIAAVVIVAAIGVIVGVIVGLYLAFQAAYNYLAGLDFGAIASDMMAGLVAGITSGASAVMNAIKNLAQNMKGAIKSALGISSPSKVFAEFGLNTSMGMAEGMEEGAGDVADATAGLVSIPSAAATGGAGTAITNGGGVVVNINVQADGGDAEGIAEAVRRAVVSLFEGEAITMGAPLPEGT